MTSCDLLVAGGTGFVGAHVVANARAVGQRVAVADWDLRDAELTAARVAALQPVAVAHLAAAPRGLDPWSALSDDVRMLGSVLDGVARHVPDAAVLVTGSAAEYGMGSARRLVEDDELEPVGAYGAAKRVLRYAAMAEALPTGVRVIWARAFNHLGPGQREDAPASQWCRQIAAAELAGFGVLRIGSPTPIRDFLDVRDVADAYLALLRSDVAGVVNVCSGVPVAVGALADLLLGHARVPVTREVDPRLVRTTDPAQVVGDPGRLSAATGWAPRIALEHSLRDLLDEWRERTAQGVAAGEGVR